MQKIRSTIIFLVFIMILLNIVSCKTLDQSYVQVRLGQNTSSIPHENDVPKLVEFGDDQGNCKVKFASDGKLGQINLITPQKNALLNIKSDFLPGISLSGGGQPLFYTINDETLASILNSYAKIISYKKSNEVYIFKYDLQTHLLSIHYKLVADNLYQINSSDYFPSADSIIPGCADLSMKSLSF